MELNLIVLYSSDMERLLSFYQSMGLKFVEEKHENSPRHYACQLGSLVLELYPEGRRHHPNAALGFVVDNLDALIENVEGKYIYAQPREWEYGRTALLYDPDGRKIILQEKKKL